MPPRKKSAPTAPTSRPAARTGNRPTAASQTDPSTLSATYLTTAQGLRLPDTDHSLKAGERGPTLLEDFHLREKITHFDHERIPERVVHARGAAAHGIFRSTARPPSVTKAGFLATGRRTDVFVRFSTVAGSRGSADTVRDVRGSSTCARRSPTSTTSGSRSGSSMPAAPPRTASSSPTARRRR